MFPLRERETDDAVANGVNVADDGDPQHHGQRDQKAKGKVCADLLKWCSKNKF